MGLDIINKLFAIDSSVNTTITSSHITVKAFRNTNFTFKMNSVLRCPGSLVLIILMNIIINVFRMVFNVFNRFVTFFHRIETNLSVDAKYKFFHFAFTSVLQ